MSEEIDRNAKLGTADDVEGHMASSDASDERTASEDEDDVVAHRHAKGGAPADEPSR
jgi:hypothetical protein